MEHLNGEFLVALGTGPGGVRPASPPEGGATAGRRTEARAAERMDRRRSLKPMEQVQALGFLAATALLLIGAFIHGSASKAPPLPHATARV